MQAVRYTTVDAVTLASRHTVIPGAPMAPELIAQIARVRLKDHSIIAVVFDLQDGAKLSIRRELAWLNRLDRTIATSHGSSTARRTDYGRRRA